MPQDDIVGKTQIGLVVAGEFVGENDEEGREPGTYITIRFDDPDAILAGGPASVTYLALRNSDPVDAGHLFAKYPKN